jgi:hypothetical protein
MTKKEPEAEAVYTPPASQVQLEAFLERDKAQLEASESGEAQDLPEPYQNPNVTRTDLVARDYGTSEEDRAGFVNVDPMYQNFASETDKALLPTEGPEAENFRRAGFETPVAEESDSPARSRRSTPPPTPGE